VSIVTHGFGSPVITTFGWGSVGGPPVCPKHPRAVDAVLLRPRAIETDLKRPRAIETDRLRPRALKSEEDC
jgi:hypothetical protein